MLSPFHCLLFFVEQVQKVFKSLHCFTCSAPVHCSIGYIWHATLSHLSRCIIAPAPVMLRHCTYDSAFSPVTLRHYTCHAAQLHLSRCAISLALATLRHRSTLSSTQRTNVTICHNTIITTRPHFRNTSRPVTSPSHNVPHHPSTASSPQHILLTTTHPPSRQRYYINLSTAFRQRNLHEVS